MKKRNMSTLILVIVFLAGICVLLYPTVSDWWNSQVQTRAIADYESALAEMDETDYAAAFEQAEAYNEALKALPDPLSRYEELEGYEEILDVTETKIMGYLTIPRLDLELPVYHGTSDSVLTIAAGHLEGSSLPIGGESTHAVLSAHRGLPSAKLFSDLDQMEEGDIFTIKVLDRLLTYEVDRIRIVEPEEIGELAIVEGEDHVTLLTCTPYGINTHRLLVRGTRIANIEGTEAPVINDAYEMDSTLTASLLAVPMLLILLLVLLVRHRKRR